MPTFIRPARVVVDQGGGTPVLAVAGAAVAVAAAGAVVAFVVAWWPLLLGGAAVTVAVTGLSVRALHRRTVCAWPTRVALPPRGARALSAPPYRIPAPKPVTVPGIVLAQPRAITGPRKDDDG